jgi:hypothetical protein
LASGYVFRTIASHASFDEVISVDEEEGRRRREEGGEEGGRGDIKRGRITTTIGPEVQKCWAKGETTGGRMGLSGGGRKGMGKGVRGGDKYIWEEGERGNSPGQEGHGSQPHGPSPTSSHK